MPDNYVTDCTSMNLKTIVRPFVPEFILAARGVRSGSISEFSFDENLGVKQDIESKYGPSELLDLFAGNKDFIVHKWHHYIPLYERYFSAFRGKKIKFLEIGVSKGGSLQMWRKYLGDDAVIFGIDIDPECAQYNGLAGQVRIGSQVDKRFLDAVIREMGGVDVVLDDGSHHMDHVSVSLTHIFPHLTEGGVYMIEDLHTAYWSDWGGGHRNKTNFFAFVMDLVDDLHHWYHKRGIKQAAVSSGCTGIHIHDSIVVLDKGNIYIPVHSKNS